MAKPKPSSQAAYVQLRLGDPQALATVRGQISDIERKIAELQSQLGRERGLALLREQGLLFAWAHVKASAHRELTALAAQPWLAQLTAGADRQTLCVTAGLHESQDTLILTINASNTPAVRAVQPEPSVGHDTALGRTILSALVAEGRLVEAVVAYAERRGLALSRTRTAPAVTVSDEALQAYVRQRSAWLCQNPPPEPAQLTPVEVVVGQLDALYRKLFVLDQQARQLAARGADSEQCQALEDEYAALLRLPHVAALTVENGQIELRTDAISIRGICVGEFLVTCNLLHRAMHITNLTRPYVDDDVRFDHPHIREGNPCLGNIQQHVAELLASRDLSKLIPLMIDFLCSYSPSNPHRPLEMWM